MVKSESQIHLKSNFTVKLYCLTYQTDIRYPYCLPPGVISENGENQDRENLPNTACMDFHLDFLTQRASSFLRASIPVSSFQMADT